jgi:hypothetical protein
VFQVMARYTRPNLSEGAAQQVEDFVQVAASLADTFVFIYMGTLLFIEPEEWHTWRFTVRCKTHPCGVRACVHGRVCACVRACVRACM